jgi:predicted membrane GTPase involved in stress response
MAHTYLNQVRRRGYGFEVNTPNIISDIEQGTKSALYEVLKEERARELGFELMRKDDIVRWGEFYSRMNAMRGMINQVSSSVTISYYQNARLYFNNFKSCDEFWPIPSYELGLNPNMKQNVGF